MPSRRLPAALVLVVAAGAFYSVACGSGSNTGFVGSVAPDPDAAGITLSGREAGGGGLDAYIEQGHVQVKLITLSCAGDCATVEAVGAGGNPPYTFLWEDGATAATRSVCPTSSTSYSVTITDTAAGGELKRPAETAQAVLTADVLSCPDGGASDGGARDAGTSESAAPDGSGPLCVENPSFEGAARAPGIDSSPWANCTATGIDTAIIDPTMPGSLPNLPAPSDGRTYLELIATYSSFGPGGSGVITEPLCAPMHAGASYSFEVDLANGSGVGLTPTALVILGGSQSCDMEEVLWTSPVAGTTWSRFCATLTPTNDWSYLTLEVTETGTSNLFIDHIVPVASCP
jgi:hypothetical protein